MCGIAVTMGRNGWAAPIELSSLAHRGPDGRGEWRSGSGNCWMGHARLAILDLTAAGAQPMISADGKFVIVFNGEIYNHLHLRKTLDAPVGGWRGTSDTETLLHAYAQWGEGMLAQLSGMFAFAIVDTEKGDLFTAVDRFGMKPLYFRSLDESFQLCSESRALVRRGDGVTPETLTAYLRWGCLPPGTSLWSEIHMLQPGHWMRVGSDLRVDTGRYWPSDSWRSSQDTRAKTDVKELVEAAVERHLLSDVPVATFLSGGIDSSIVTMTAAKKLGGNLQSFCVSLTEQGFNESRFAEMVAKRFGTQHTSILVTEAEALELVESAVDRMDAPSMDAVNTYLVASGVRERGIKVALSGLGGDELFGGYPSFRDMRTLSRMATLPRWMSRALGPFSSKAARIEDIPTGDVATLARWRRCMTTRRECREAGLPHAEVAPEWSPVLADSFTQISWQELMGYMAPMLLRDSDQMSMAVSLELRLPFLDHRLVEFVLGLPETAKRGRNPKQLLIDAFKDDLPAEVWNRPKQGFELPMDRWMRGPLQEFVKAGLECLSSGQLLNEAFLRKRESEFKNRKIHWTRLWSLVVLGHYIARHGGWVQDDPGARDLLRDRFQ